MDEASARAAAESFRPQAQVTPEFVLTRIERRIIELAKLPQGESETRDCLVWAARYEADAAWIELAIDDATGALVRVKRSRERPPDEVI